VSTQGLRPLSFVVVALRRVRKTAMGHAQYRHDLRNAPRATWVRSPMPL
jgi:hypothetical protein